MSNCHILLLLHRYRGNFQALSQKNTNPEKNRANANAISTTPTETKKL